MATVKQSNAEPTGVPHLVPSCNVFVVLELLLLLFWLLLLLLLSSPNSGDG